MNSSLQTYKPNKVKSKKVTIEISGELKKVHEIYLDGVDYQMAATSSMNMACNHKTGQYGSGIVNDKDDPFRVERTGKLGEIAFAKKYGLSVDVEYKASGDQYDFFENEKTIDVKTATGYKPFEAGLILAQKENGIRIPLSCDVYVFAYLENEYVGKWAIIRLVGYIKREQITEEYVSPAIVGTHLNYQIPYSSLSLFP